MLSTEVNCCNPLLIVSPKLREDALRSDCYFVDGKKRTISSSMFFDLLDVANKPSRVLEIPFVHSLSDDFCRKHTCKEVQEAQDRLDRFVNDSFLLDSETGETRPIYTFVPCGKCDACNHSKLVSYVQRCQFAMEETQLPAAFVTLTYNKWHLPNDYRPRKRHIQLFKKRFKRNLNKVMSIVLSEDGIHPVDVLPRDYSRDVKFICVSEFGKLGRPHYHLIMFGCPRFSKFDAEHDYYLRLLVAYCWRVPIREYGALYQTFESYAAAYPKVLNRSADYDSVSYGFSSVSEVSSSTVVNYVMKYSFKDVDKKDCNFKSVSQNLGLQWLRIHADKIEDGDGKFKYMSHFDMSVNDINLSGYYLKKLFPSSSQLVPPDVRKQYIEIYYLNEYIQRNPRLSNDVKYAAMCSAIYARESCPYLALSDIIAHDDYKHYERNYIRDSISADFDNSEYDYYLLRGLAESFTQFVEMSSKIDFAEVQRKVASRDKFFSKFKKRPRSEVLLNASRARRDIIINQSKSVLL